MTSTTGFPAGPGGDLPHDEWRAMAAAYAIDALDDHERVAFEAHLATCAECRALVASYVPVTEALGRAVESVALPADLRARTLARATAQPRALARPAASTSTQVAPVGRSTGAPWWLAAAALVTAAGLGFYALGLHKQIDTLRAMFNQAAVEAQALRAELVVVRGQSSHLVRAIEVLSATDLRRVALAGQDRASAAVAHAYVSPTRGLMFSAEHLPALATGHVYQLWVITKTPVSVGVLTPAANGTSTTTLPMPANVTIDAITAVAVTDEPNPQGSPTPTMPILLVGATGR
jgi:anti-sigma-K factor RskA